MPDYLDHFDALRERRAYLAGLSVYHLTRLAVRRAMRGHEGHSVDLRLFEDEVIARLVRREIGVARFLQHAIREVRALERAKKVYIDTHREPL